VIVIDDDASVLDSMAGLFENWGCRVITAESHAKVVARLSQLTTAPDIIVSDYQLPGEMNGLEAIADLRSRASAQIPAFLISGDTNPETLRRAKENGLYLLHKPVEPMALRAMFSLVLRKSTQKAQ